MSEVDYHQFLTGAEVEALERPGLRNRAKAIAALHDLATLLGVSGDAVEGMTARIRAMDKHEAQVAYQTLTGAVGLVDGLVDEVPVTEESADEPEREADGVIDEPVGDEEVEAPKAEEIHIDYGQTRGFLSSIAERTKGDYITVPTSADELDSDEVLALLALDAEKSARPNMAARNIDIMLARLTMGVKATLAQFKDEIPSESSLHSRVHNTSTRIVRLLDERMSQGVVGAEPSVDSDPPGAERGTADEQVDLEAVEAVFGDDYNYRLDRVESFLGQLKKNFIDLGHITAEDFNHETMRVIAEGWMRSSKIDESRKEVYLVCLWGWLAGLDTSELVETYGKVKDKEPTRQDIVNARATIVTTLSREVQKGNLQLDFSVTQEQSGDEEESAEHEEHDVPQEESGEAHRDGVVTRFASMMDTDINLAAFRGLLDPDNRGEFTPAKKVVIEQLRNLIGKVSPDGAILNELDVKSSARATLRRLLGMGFMQGDRYVERTPEPLRDQVHGSPSIVKERQAEELYDAMDQLFNALRQATPVVPEVVQQKENILQVDFTGGVARLG